VKTFITALATILVCSSVAIAQDARFKTDNLETDAANGLQPNGSPTAHSRVIWRTPENRPLTWEEQRAFDSSSESFWLFPSTKAHD
jgi:hypothetical protein